MGRPKGALKLLLFSSTSLAPSTSSSHVAGLSRSSQSP
jgi:hypothetical protein